MLFTLFTMRFNALNFTTVYNRVNDDCANYPGCANKQGSNYPGSTRNVVPQQNSDVY